MPSWESEEGTVDQQKYNESLMAEPARDAMRFQRTSTYLRQRVIEQLAQMNGEQLMLPDGYIEVRLIEKQ